MNALGNCADVSIRLLDSYTVAQASDCEVVVRCPAWIFAAYISRQPQTYVWRELEPVREHADNGIGRATNLQVRLREVRRRSEVLPPVSITGKNDRRGPFLRVAGAEIPPENRLNSEDLEKVGGDAGDRSTSRPRSTRNGCDQVMVFRNRQKAAILIAKI